MKIDITVKKNDDIRLQTLKFSKSVSGDDVTYSINIDDLDKEDKKSVVRFLSDKLDTDMHHSTECMSKLYDKIDGLDNASDLKHSYNRLMSNLEDYGL